MPKRMLLTLPDDLHEILMTFSKLTGTPASSFVVGILQNAKPDLVRINEITQAANQKVREDTIEALTDLLNEKENQFKEERNNVKELQVDPGGQERRTASGASEAAHALIDL